MKADSQQKNSFPDADQLYAGESVREAIVCLAEQINRELADQPIVALCIMNGGLVFSGQLLPLLNMPLVLDYMHVTRYRGAETGSDRIDWLVEPKTDLKGKTVLILDDIFDEGKTLENACQWLRDAGVNRICTAVLLDKQHDRKPALYRPEYAALEVEDRYVFGMGMDVNGLWRNADGIWALKAAH